MLKLISGLWKSKKNEQVSLPPTESAPLSATEICIKAGELIRNGRLLQAEEQYKLALQIDNNCAKAYRLLGYIYKEQHNFAAAKINLQKAVTLDSHDADALYMLGCILKDEANYADAGELLARSSKLDPQNPFAIKDLIFCLHKLGDNQNALQTANYALQLFPDLAEIYLYRGNIEIQLLDYAMAEASFKLALQKQPGSIELLKSIAEVQFNQNKLTEALTTHQKILLQNPNDSEVRLFMSFCQLTMGELKTGFENYQYRFKVEGGEKLIPKLPQPVWQGQFSLSKKVLLIIAEQGFGDFIQFVRYCNLVTKAGGKFILFVQKPLLTIMQDSFGAENVITDLSDAPHFDYYCSVMNLPYAFGTELNTIPDTTPYIKSNEALTSNWKKDINFVENKPLIGISWSGNREFKRDFFRSIELDNFLNLIDNNFNYVVLQTNISTKEREALQKYSNILIPANPIRSFADTAAIMQFCTAIISVDTAIIHLAGALARPSHLLLPYTPDWRWLLERTDSPWYPSLTIYRQTQIGNWATPIQTVKQNLSNSVEHIID